MDILLTPESCSAKLAATVVAAVAAVTATAAAPVVAILIVRVVPESATTRIAYETRAECSKKRRSRKKPVVGQNHYNRLSVTMN